MCGLTGVFGRTGATHAMLARSLSIFNESRGRDSFGYLERCVEPNKDGNHWMFDRTIQSASAYLAKPENAQLFFGNNVTLTHCRGASKLGAGGSSAYATNAHPFTFGSITGAHNGFIANWDDVVKEHDIKRPDGTAVCVDSEVIFWLIANKGVEALNQLTGLACIWWYDATKPETIFIRNWRKDLSIHASKGLLAFASEARFLAFLGMDSEPVAADGRVWSISVKTREVKEVAKVEGKTVETSGYVGTWGGISYRYNTQKTKRLCVRVHEIDRWVIFSENGWPIGVSDSKRLPQDFNNYDHRGSSLKEINKIRKSLNNKEMSEEDLIVEAERFKYPYGLDAYNRSRLPAAYQGKPALLPGVIEDGADKRDEMFTARESTDWLAMLSSVLDGSEMGWCTRCQQWTEVDQDNEIDGHCICPMCNCTDISPNAFALWGAIERNYYRIRPTDRAFLIDGADVKSDKDVLDTLQATIFCEEMNKDDVADEAAQMAAEANEEIETDITLDGLGWQGT